MAHFEKFPCLNVMRVPSTEKSYLLSFSNLKVAIIYTEKPRVPSFFFVFFFFFGPGGGGGGEGGCGGDKHRH